MTKIKNTSIEGIACTGKNKNQSQIKLAHHDWTNKGLNLVEGCQHGCRYCYGKAMSIKFRHKSSTHWDKPTICAKRLGMEHKKTKEVVQFPSMHDIHPENLSECVFFLKRYLSVGNKVLIVSKPHKECIERLCKELGPYKNQIEYRFTIGSTDSGVLKFWEPHAPDYDKRLHSLKHAFEQGYVTSVSGEPMLDNAIEKVVEATLPFVRTQVWIGLPNRLLYRMKVNGFEDADSLEKANDLLGWLSDDRIIEIYNRYKGNSKIAFKSEIRAVVERMAR